MSWSNLLTFKKLDGLYNLKAYNDSVRAWSGRERKRGREREKSVRVVNEVSKFKMKKLFL